MWCLVCFQTPHNPHCPKNPKPLVAFHCDKCGEPVYVAELEDANCHQTPDNRIICGKCVCKMTARQALEYLGCITRTWPDWGADE